MDIRLNTAELEAHETLGVYRQVKLSEPQVSAFNISMRHPGTRVRMALRSNTYPLMSRVADNHPDWPFNRRLCPFCNLKVPETVEHLIAQCPNYHDLRLRFEECIAPRRHLLPRGELVNIVLNDRTLQGLEPNEQDELVLNVLNFLKLIDGRRHAVWKRLTKPGKPWQLRV